MMSITKFENQIVVEASSVTGKTLKLIDLMEWATTPVFAQKNEFLVYCPDLKIYTVFKKKK